MGMQTKISLFCDKVIEAGWLIGLIIIPLFFKMYSQRVFEPDKLALLRSIALFVVTARVIRFIDRNGALIVQRFRRGDRGGYEEPRLLAALPHTSLFCPSSFLPASSPEHLVICHSEDQPVGFL